MKAFRKTILFLGIAVVLLGASPGAAAEDDNDVLTPACVTLTAGGAGISPKARGTVQARAQLPGTDVVAPRPIHVKGHASNFVFHDSRSTLRILCLLLC